MLTPKQAAVLRHIMDALERTGVCPSYQEISDALGMKSKGRVAATVDQLEQRGYVRRLGFARRRALEVLKEPGGAFVTTGDVLEMIRAMMEGATVLGEYDDEMDVRVDRPLWETIIREVQDRCIAE